MNVATELPGHVAEVLDFASFAEFASLIRAGYPIDAPLLSFPDEDRSSIVRAAGLAYPVKAERARRSPKVSLFYAPAAAVIPSDPPELNAAAKARPTRSNKGAGDRFFERT